MLHDFPIIDLKFGDRTLKIYVAITAEQKIQGLSNVSDLRGCHGMIFPFDGDKPRTFTFRKTLLPLKVYFIGSDGKVVQSSSATSGQHENIHCSIPSRWVLELHDK